MIWASSGPPGGPLGGLLGRLGGFLGELGGHLAVFEAILEASWRNHSPSLGSSWGLHGNVGALLEHLGTISGPSSCAFGRF